MPDYSAQLEQLLKELQKIAEASGSSPQIGKTNDQEQLAAVIEGIEESALQEFKREVPTFQQLHDALKTSGVGNA